MPAQMYPSPAPTEAEILVAREVLRAARLSALRQRRADRRAGHPVSLPSNFRRAAFLCGWCGQPFEARVMRTIRGRPAIARWCSKSCRELAYQRRKRIVARREALAGSRGV